MNKKPNVFIVGAPKCGTTSMAHYLSERNDVFVCDPKEPNYFSTDLNEKESYSGLFFRSERDYLELFSASEEQSVKIDASTSYLWSRDAAENIRNRFPEAKVIVMLRDPTELVISLHKEELYSFAEDEESFEIAWSLQQSRKEGRNIPSACREPKKLFYKDIASHGENLKRLYNYFGRENVLIVFMDDMKTDMRTEYLRVLNFIGLPIDERTDFPRINEAKEHKYRKISRFMKRNPIWLDGYVSSLRKVAWKLGLKGVRAKLLSKLTVPSTKSDVSEELKQKIRREFIDDVTLLEELTSRDLKSWKVQV
ncbi:sulfotransferase domain-containing protein [Ferrimonas pelagia]|uniref:Sulfotransferase n=1 Tax=Ferrimonas pelagia TaxID=1177826 RepID=A0ABP9EDQ0_9GAMM